MDQQKTFEQLLAENKKLTAEVIELRKQNEANTARIKELEEILLYFKNQLFGQKSEKTNAQDPDQLSLFGDSESVFSGSELTDEQSTQESKTTLQKSQKKRQKREEQVAGLEVVTKVYRRESGLCPFGHKLKLIGKKSLGKKLRFLTAKLWLEDQYLETYTCDCNDCLDKQAGGTAFYSAQAPGNLFLHSSITAELLSNIVYQKYSLGTPLYRQLKDWHRLGWSTSESTLSRLVIHGSKIVQPLTELLHAELLKAPYLQGDETVVQVLREPHKKATAESRMWVLRTPQSAQRQGIYYAYKPDRTAKSGQELYAGFAGVLQCDGYSVYASVDCRDRVGCLAHVRRKFFEAAKRDCRAKRPLKMLDQMFHLEKQWQGLFPNELKKLRKQRLAPLLKNFWQCLAELPALPQSMLGKAIKYADGQKTAIDKLLQYGALDLSNNTCEQAIKSLIIDRKNFLFSTSIAGAKANAIWLTLIESAKANGLDPLQYLFDILTALSQPGPLSESELSRYLPWNQTKKAKNTAA